MRGDRLALGALLLLVAGFALGLVLLARERYTRGDGYPAGSSYRTDPLGTRALHDALDEIGGVTVRRHVGPASGLSGGSGTVVMLLAAEDALGTYDPDLVRAVETIALAGGRVVVSLATPTVNWFDAIDDDEDEDAKEQPDEAGKKGAEPSQPPPPPPLGARWGFASQRCPKGIEPTAAALPVESIAKESDLPWRGGGCLERLSAPWHPLYTREGHVAVAERPFGKGSLVLLADGYVLSNEALLFDPRPAAIARLLGPARTVLFEESHHGVRERPGVAALFGRYHLRGALAVSALLFALWAWWAATPLVPAAGAAGAPARAGREAALGLLGLLRRGLPPPKLMGICVEEWRKAFGRSRPAVAEALGRMGLEGSDLPAIYRRARETVNPRGGDDGR
jgi:hypothetical protein